MNYPIAEIFYSIQGEGANVGRAAWFVRLAGCCVGKKTTFGEGANMLKAGNFPILCHTADGTPFACDTDFRARETKNEEEIGDQLRSEAQCTLVFITGGEPFAQDILPLVRYLYHSGYEVWVETSGTRFINTEYLQYCQIILSPKAGCIPANYRIAHHLKILVDVQTELPALLEHPMIYLQPIEAPKDAERSADNVARAITLVLQNPEMKLSMQVHKALGVR
jgi:organic radical activating enzyme